MSKNIKDNFMKVAGILILANLALSFLTPLSILPVNTWTITLLSITSFTTVMKLPENSTPSILYFLSNKKHSKMRSLGIILGMSFIYSLLAKAPGTMSFIGLPVTLGNPIFTMLFMGGTLVMLTICITVVEACFLLNKENKLSSSDNFSAIALITTLLCNFFTTISFYIPYLSTLTVLNTLTSSTVSFVPILLSTLFSLSELTTTVGKKLPSKGAIAKRVAREVISSAIRPNENQEKLAAKPAMVETTGKLTPCQITL